MKNLEEYLNDIWKVLPLYSFYEIGYSSLPWSDIKNRVFIYSTTKTTKLNLKQVLLSKFFNLCEVYCDNASYPIGYVIIQRDFIEKVKVRYTSHAISACTPVMSAEEVKRLGKKCMYDRNELSLFSYGNDAEVITDLHKVMGVTV